jgi:hypothetical protein
MESLSLIFQHNSTSTSAMDEAAIEIRHALGLCPLQ